MGFLAYSRVAALAACFLVAATNVVSAGGYLRVKSPDGVNSRIDRWDPSKPIVYNLDQGPLGKLSKSQADALVSSAIDKWSANQIPGSVLQFQRGVDLPEDHGDGHGTDPAYKESAADGLTAIIYDQQGRITASLYGGAERVTVAFAGPRWIKSDGTIREGRAVYNGLFFDGSADPVDLSQEAYEGVVTHEIGHILNLDHSSMNEAAGAMATSTIPGALPDLRGVPTMFPLTHSNATSLELDDRAWIANLYPSAQVSQMNAIHGVVRGVDGNPVNGLNLVARHVDDPNVAVSCISGYNDAPGTTPRGQFIFPALPAYGRWVIDFEEIRSNFSGSSAVGLIDPPLRLPAPVEWVNEAGVEGSNDNLLISTSFDPGGPGAQITGLVAQLNLPTPDMVVTEQDPNGNTFPQDAMGVAVHAASKCVINGTISPAEGGNISLDGNVVEDWYLVDPPSGIEIRRITLTPSGSDDLSFHLVAWDGTSTPSPWISRNRAGSGGQESLETSIDTTLLMPDTRYAGKLFIAVSTRGNGGSYRLEIESTPSDRDAVVVAHTVRTGAATVRVYGRGFKNTWGSPEVTFSHPNLFPYDVRFVSSRELEVSVLETGAVSGRVTTQVVNLAGAASYGGRYANDLSFNSPLPALISRLLKIDAAAGDENKDRIIDAADLTYTITR